MKKFRRSLMGFNKKDVVAYIEELARDSSARQEDAALRIARLEKSIEEADGLRAKLELTEGECRHMTEVTEELKARATQSDFVVTELKGKVTQLANELADKAAADAAIIDARDERITELELALKVSEEENASLKKHNLALLERLSHTEARPQPVRAEEPPIRERAKKVAADVRQDAEVARELFDVFKSRLLDISRELASIAQAILEAEEESTPSAEVDYDYDDSEEQQITSAYEAGRSAGIKSLLDRIKNIGEKLR